MGDKSDGKRWRWGPAILVTFVLLAIYVLSAKPAEEFRSHSGDWYETLYWPLTWLYRNDGTKLFTRFMNWYNGGIWR